MSTLSATAREIFSQALAACSVEKAVAKAIRVDAESLSINGYSYPRRELEALRIVSVGKPANAMLEALLRQLPNGWDLDIAGVLIAPSAPKLLPPGFHFFAGGHPLPNRNSFEGARAALDLMQSAAESAVAQRTLCIFLIGGGSSALMDLPLDDSIDLADAVEFHRILVAGGASIAEINCVRKHFSRVKGGRLAQAAGDALCHSLLISDVPEGQEDALGSGPTLPDSSTVTECREILARYGLLAQFPTRVRHFFEQPDLPETPKPTEFQARASVLLSSKDLAQAAARHADAIGWKTVIDTSADEQDYRTVAESLLSMLESPRREYGRVCLISAGEALVRLPTRSSEPAPIGIGGRNQQLALYAATLLKPGDGPTAFLSAGSDGIDGNSPAAGAVVDETTLTTAAIREHAEFALNSFDSHPFLYARNATLMPGPTGNNLRDLRILLAEPGRDSFGE
jgi:hydroxypyruvate reductase